jgi:hypothetical protein
MSYLIFPAIFMLLILYFNFIVVHEYTYCGGGPHFKEPWQTKEYQGTDRMGRKDGFSTPGSPDGTKMFPCMRNSNHNSRKRQPISKAHKSGDSQSKVA